MLTQVVIPSLVREICRKSGLVVASQYFFHVPMASPDELFVSFYLANDDGEEVVVVRLNAVVDDRRLLFKEADSVTVTTPYSCFNQETIMTTTDDREENYPVIAKMVAKLLKAK